MERINGRLGCEVSAINVCSHRSLERLLRGFNAAYDAKCQQMLDA